MMTIDEVYEHFDNDDNYVSFSELTGTVSTRADLNVMITLDRLFPSTEDIISAAEHDIIYFNISIEQLASVATPELIKILKASHCVIEQDSLAMYC